MLTPLTLSSNGAPSTGRQLPSLPQCNIGNSGGGQFTQLNPEEAETHCIDPLQCIVPRMHVPDPLQCVQTLPPRAMDLGTRLTVTQDPCPRPIVLHTYCTSTGSNQYWRVWFMKAMEMLTMSPRPIYVRV